MLKRSSIVSVVAGIAGLTSVILFGCSSPTKPNLAEPTLRAPANNSSFQPDTLTLFWNAVDGATSYSIQVSTASDFSPLGINATSPSPSFAITTPLVNNTTYYWRVNASIGGSRTSPWSASYSFTVAVASPSMTNPGKGSMWVPDNVTLTWDEASLGATMFYLQLSTESAFSSPAIDDSTDSASFPITTPLLDSTTYYVHFKASTPQGMSDWSPVDSFTTWPPIEIPALTSPADGATIAATDLLTWSGPVTFFPTTYHVQVSTMSDFSSGIVLDVESISSPQSQSISTLGSGTYYWRVSATVNFLYSYMRTGAWSPTQSFILP